MLGEGRYFKVHICPDFLNDAEFFRVSKFVREFELDLNNVGAA